MHVGVENNPKDRITELLRRRKEINEEIERIRDGNLTMLDDTALRGRFQQFMQLARDLLGDFHEVEHNFRGFDRHIRERIALWDGSHGALLDEVINERDAIDNSDQGRSFNTFWDFLMSQDRQEELTSLLERVLALPAVQGISPDARTRRVHYDWLKAGEHTQSTMRRLSQQLRRFLDDQAWLENRRIIDILRSIEANALALREAPPKDTLMIIPSTTADIHLTMERRLYTQTTWPLIAGLVLEAGDEDVDTGGLFSEVPIDKARIEAHIRRSLQEQSQVTLGELCQAQPVELGLAELIAYLQLTSEPDTFHTVMVEDAEERVSWRKVIFVYL